MHMKCFVPSYWGNHCILMHVFLTLIKKSKFRVKVNQEWKERFLQFPFSIWENLGESLFRLLGGSDLQKLSGDCDGKLHTEDFGAFLAECSVFYRQMRSSYEDFTHINNTLNNGVMAAGLSQMVSEDLLSHWYLYILLSTVWWFSFNLTVPSFYISAISCGSTKRCLYLLVYYQQFFYICVYFQRRAFLIMIDWICT